jgi:hypothetical protein
MQHIIRAWVDAGFLQLAKPKVQRQRALPPKLGNGVDPELMKRLKSYGANPGQAREFT